MVKVDVKWSHSNIEEIAVTGHAGYAPKGQDLVCAGVSSICVGMMNALYELAEDTCSFSMKEADIKIQVKQVTNENQILLKGLLFQLKTLEESYKKFIHINEQEV